MYCLSKIIVNCLAACKSEITVCFSQFKLKNVKLEAKQVNNLHNSGLICFVSFELKLQELKESFNYGLFAPPCNGKAGKFLDEERPLSDYPFSGPVGYLEVS